MDTEPFDEAELLALPASPAASPPRRLKRLKKSSSQTTATTSTTVATTTSPPTGSPPPPSPPQQQASPGGETLAPSPSSPPNPSPRPPTPPDANAPTPLPHSSPAPVSSPLPPTDSPDNDEEDDGLDPLFSETVGAGGWDPLGAPAEGEDGDEEELLGGGLIEELRRENSVKKRLDMDEAERGMAAGAEAKGKRSKRKRQEEAPKESAREKKRSEKERRAQLDSIHAESQRLLRETRSASFRPIVQPVCKPISSLLEKIRLRKLEILKKSSTTTEDNDAASEPAIDSAVRLDVPQVKEVTRDDKDLRIDGVEELGTNGHELDQCGVAEDEDDLNCKEKDLHTKASDEEASDRSQENHEENTQSSEKHNDSVDQTQLPPSSSPAKKSTDDESSSEDEEEEDNNKENIEPSTQDNDVNTREHLQRAIGGDSCPDNAILKDFLDDEAEEEDDSDNDMMRFKDDDEDDGSDENEVFNDLIAAGYEEKEVDHDKRNELHQKWLQQQDAAETNNVMQRLKFGHQEQKSVHEDEDEDIEDSENESEKEMSYDLTPANVVRQNSEKAKQMIAKMFADDNDTYDHSDDEEIEEYLARQRISKREVDNNTFISPLEDDSSREVFGLIKKLNIAPQPERRGKQSTSNHELLMTGKNSSASKSSFLGRTASGSMVSSYRSVHRSYVFGRDDSNSSTRSCMSTSESFSDMDQTNSSQPKKAKFSSSQQKPVGPRANSKSDTNSGVSLFEILRRTSSVTSDRQELSSQESCSTITESQAVHQFSAFKLSRRFSRVGARN
ncbi:hypothetical protein SETIT_9G042800v2 [Setaria italica]|uniref:DNA replication checkpoint mediator MRC1 domain-containing protein n=1 Tax=Setaria italica TaxID=4555 RepID=K4A619_SETIT|nr:PH domain-containing protein DDB_G0287875 [Setaria italica]RCV40315.1 hypothetical protein SETIT_9G042800v2 [Setaria italica]